MAPGTPGPSGAFAPLEPFPVPQRTLDLRREDVYLRIALSVSVESGDRLDARRAFETALTRAMARAHGVVGGAVDAEVLEGSVAVVSGGDGEGGVGGSSSGAPPVSAGSPSTDTVRLAGVVKAPASAEVKITSALAACHPDGARVVARAADLVALGIDARAATRRAVVGA